MKKILLPLTLLTYAALAFGHLSAEGRAQTWQPGETYAIDGGPIASAQYDESQERLTLVFRSGATYAYAAVSRKTWLTFMRVQYKGSFFNRHIRGAYESRRLGGHGTHGSTP